MDTDFLNAWADCLHGFPIGWFESVLNRTEFEACGASGFIGKISKIIEAGPYKVQRLHSYQYYISFYIFSKANFQDLYRVRGSTTAFSQEFAQIKGHLIISQQIMLFSFPSQGFIRRIDGT
jgi:hypothetical protein